MSATGSTLALDPDLLSVQEARALAEKARAAQAEFATFNQAQVDRVVAAMAGVGSAAAEELARTAVEESGFGVYADKVFKNRFASEHIHRSLQGLTTVGVVRYDPETGVVEIAEPMGVLCALAPVTAPTADVLGKSLIALKARNAIIFSPHPRSPRSSAMAADLMNKAAMAAGAPDGLVQCMHNVSLAGTNELMRHPHIALILASGGGAMVKAAYSAGKPAIAVGPGNVPVYVDRSVTDFGDLAHRLVQSKIFDNGTPCASEQSLVVDRPVATTLRWALEREGCYFLNEREAGTLRGMIVMPDGSPNVNVVGCTAERLAELAGFRVPAGTRVLVAPVLKVGRSEPFSAEILTTLLAWYEVDGTEAGIARCNELLNFGGLGHTCGIWAENAQVVAAYSLRAKAFRVLVNCPTSVGAIGALSGLDKSLIIGTGTWGGGIFSDNITTRHLMHLKRMAGQLGDFGTAG